MTRVTGQAKINGDKEEYCRSFGETLKKSMSDHEMRSGRDEVFQHLMFRAV